MTTISDFLNNEFTYYILNFLVWIQLAICQPPHYDFITTEDVAFDANKRGLPGETFEFKINVEAGRQECLFQKLQTGANLHLAFEVMKGADRNLDFVIFDPRGEVIAKHLWTKQGVSDISIHYGGVYGFCMDNTFSRFSAKLVYFFLSSYVPEEWKKYTEELQEFDLSVYNFTEFMGKIDRNIGQMGQLQAVSRQHAVTDWYIIKNSNVYIERWSVVMCIVIICSSALQTYFVRRLFSSREVKPKASSTTEHSNLLLHASA